MAAAHSVPCGAFFTVSVERPVLIDFANVRLEHEFRGKKQDRGVSGSHAWRRLILWATRDETGPSSSARFRNRSK